MKQFFEGITSIPQNFSLPTLLSIIAAGCLVLLLIVFLLLRKLKLDTKTLVMASMFVTIAFVLSFVRIFTLKNGGSFTFASMLPIMLFAWLYGPIPGIAAGIVYGGLQFIQDGGAIYAPLQPFFDYVFAFGALGIVGIFKKRLALGVVVASLLRYIFHVVSGILFFSQSAEGSGFTPVIYSLIYNLIYMAPETILCLVVANIPQFRSAIRRAFGGQPATV